LTQYFNEEIEITAQVNSINMLSNPDSMYNSYNATIVSINGKLLKGKENTILYIDKNQKLHTNVTIKMNGNVADTAFSKNTLLFNYKNYLRSKKVYATIFSTNDIIVLKHDYSKLNKISNNFKEYTEHLFKSKLNDKNADIILSIILGDVDYLDDGFYDNIKVMGLAHIFAVSGSHIVLLYGVLLEFFKLIGFKRRISWVITWSLIWVYGFLIGFPLSVMRTLVMFTFLFGSEVLYRRYNSLNAIALAALILTIINPFWIFDAGFLLSFSAALSLILFSKYILKNIKTESKILITLYMYLFLQLFMLPVVAYYFNYLPIMGIIYNLLLIPIFTYILIFSFVLLIFNGLFGYILIIPFKIFDYSLYSLRYIINFTENFAFNGVVIPTFSIYEIIFIYTFIAFALYLYNNKRANCGNIGFVTLIYFYCITYILVPWTDTSMYLNIVDVGQGIFSTLSYKNYNFIFDCGSTSNKNVGEYTIVPYLTKKGINNIDGLFISHWDTDHYSGINDLIKCGNISVRNIYASTKNSDIDHDITILKKNDYVKFNDIFKVKILWPDEENILNNTNKSSLVILIKFNRRNILIPGDIESDAESKILNEFVKSDILIVPHHGSSTSSSESFVEAVKPEIAVISYGKNNYGIPSDEVIKRYEAVNSKLFSTFNQGEINFILNNDKLYYNTYVGEKSDNYYELYFVWIIPKLFLFSIIMTWIIILSSPRNSFHDFLVCKNNNMLT